MICIRHTTDTGRVCVLFIFLGGVLNKQQTGPPRPLLNAWKEVLGACIRSRQFADQMTRLEAQEARLCTASLTVVTCRATS